MGIMSWLLQEQLLSEYRDYLRMHRTYHTYVANMQDDDPLRQEIIDFGEVPINIKPSKIRDYHNKLGRIVDIMNCSDQIVKYTAAIEERHEKEARKIEYTNGKYSILMPKDAREIIREGRELQHCVGRAGYIQSMAAGKSMILFLRESKDLDTPLITIEVRDGKIRQCCRDCLLCGKKGKKKCLTRKYVGFEDIQITHLRDTGKCRAYIGK